LNVRGAPPAKLTGLCHVCQILLYAGSCTPKLTSSSAAAALAVIVVVKICAAPDATEGLLSVVPPTVKVTLAGVDAVAVFVGVAVLSTVFVGAGVAVLVTAPVEPSSG